MPTCFVIQPFDKGPFDKRYDDVLDPAIRAALLNRTESIEIPMPQSLSNRLR